MKAKVQQLLLALEANDIIQAKGLAMDLLLDEPQVKAKYSFNHAEENIFKAISSPYSGEEVKQIVIDCARKVANEYGAVGHSRLMEAVMNEVTHIPTIAQICYNIGRTIESSGMENDDFDKRLAQIKEVLDRIKR